MVPIARGFATHQRQVASVYLESVPADRTFKPGRGEHIPELDDGIFDLIMELGKRTAGELEVFSSCPLSQALSN